MLIFAAFQLIMLAEVADLLMGNGWVAFSFAKSFEGSRFLLHVCNPLLKY